MKEKQTPGLPLLQCNPLSFFAFEQIKSEPKCVHRTILLWWNRKLPHWAVLFLPSVVKNKLLYQQRYNQNRKELAGNRALISQHRSNHFKYVSITEFRVLQGMPSCRNPGLRSSLTDAIEWLIKTIWNKKKKRERKLNCTHCNLSFESICILLKVKNKQTIASWWIMKF